MCLDDILWLPQDIDELAGKHHMGDDQKIPELKNYEEMAESWDSHSLAD